MAYLEENKNKILESIFGDIEDGSSLRKCLKKEGISSKTFFSWIDNDLEKVKQYTRACELRAEALVDEMFEIADDSERDKIFNEITGFEMTNHEAIQRSKLKVDTRKWLVGKLNPKKYSDKLDLTTSGEKISGNTIPLVLGDGRTYEDLKDELKPEEE